MPSHVTLNNLQICLKNMVRDVAEEYDSEQRDLRGDNYIELRNLSCLRLDVPRQINYMLTPQFAMNRRYLAQVQNLRQRYRDLISYQFRFHIKFCMDNTFDMEMKRSTVTDAMGLVNRIHQEVLDFNTMDNDLRLQIPMFYGRSFYGLYEISNENVDPQRSLMDLIFSGDQRILPVLSKYNSYTSDFGTFVQRDYNKALNVFTNADPEYDPRVVEREVDQFEEASVIESPGVNLNTLERLLGQQNQNHKKILYVRWTFRLALILSLSALDEWLRNINLSDLPETQYNVRRWREFLNLRPR